MLGWFRQDPVMKVRAALMLERRGAILWACFVVGILFAAACDSRSEREPAPTPKSPGLEKPDIGRTQANQALGDAALGGKTQQVRLALKHGAEVNTSTAEGRTALMLAAFGGHNETINLLLERGAQVDARDAFGRTALMYSASGPYPGTVRALLERGANPNSRDAVEHWTPLMFAAAEGQADVVRALLSHGANGAVTDDDGDTALDFARRNGHAEVVRLLETNARAVSR